MKKTKIKVAFLVHNSAIWTALQPLYKRLKASSDFNVKVFTSPSDYACRGKYSGEAEVYSDLQGFGINAIRPMDIDYIRHLESIKAFAPDFLFRQTPWCLDLPAAFHFGKFDFTKLCYVPYGFMTAKIEKQQFGQEFHDKCWAIFCETQEHKTLAEKYSDIRGQNVIVTGYPRFEEIVNRKDERFWPVQTGQEDIKIIWAPHHSVGEDWLGFSTFLDNHHIFLKLAKHNPNLSIVLRPHPALFRRAVLYGVSQEAIDNFIKEFTSLPNTTIYTAGDYIPLFWTSDLLISDGIGFFSEYMLTQKPIIHTDSGCSIGFNDVGKILTGGMYKASKGTEITKYLNDILAGIDPLAKTREEIAAFLYDEKGPSPSEQIMKVIQEGFEKAQDS